MLGPRGGPHGAAETGWHLPRSGQVRRDAVYQLSKIGNNLNQLARGANTTGQVRLAERVEALLEEVRAKVAELTD